MHNCDIELLRAGYIVQVIAGNIIDSKLEFNSPLFVQEGDSVVVLIGPSINHISTIEEKPNSPTITCLEDAHKFINSLSDYQQALIYKAAYLNDMRIDKAEWIIHKERK